MARATNKRKPANRGAKKSGKGSAWLWIITICLILSLSAFLLMVTREQQQSEAAKTPDYPITSAPKETKSQKRKFEFYERLPEMKVTVPGTEPPPEPETPPVTEQYLLQIATVNDFNEADALKAELTLSGFPVTIEATTIKDKPSYRILSGPFSDHASAAAAQQELQGMQFESQIVKK